jgi:ribosome biogenesis protein Tsr3
MRSVVQIKNTVENIKNQIKWKTEYVNLNADFLKYVSQIKKNRKQQQQ